MANALKISKHAPDAGQGRLNLFVSQRRSALAVEHPYEKLARQVLFGALAAFVVLYLYFVAASVLNIIARKEASTQSLTLQSLIASLEADYFALSEGISPQMASSVGLSPVAATEYVYRPGSAVAATIRPNAF